MNAILYVALGGALGASARHMLSHAALRAFGPGFPIGTMVANVLGSFLMGLLIGYLAHRGAGGAHNLRLFVGVGVLGGFTTFSAFSLESFLLFERKDYGQLIAYAGGSFVIAIAALVFGLWLARQIWPSLT